VWGAGSPGNSTCIIGVGSSRSVHHVSAYAFWSALLLIWRRGARTSHKSSTRNTGHHSTNKQKNVTWDWTIRWDEWCTKSYSLDQKEIYGKRVIISTHYNNQRARVRTKTSTCTTIGVHSGYLYLYCHCNFCVWCL
jgi:hypothetical protein